MVLILYQFGGFLSVDARNGYRYSSYYEKVGKTEVCIDDEIPFELPDSWAWVRFENLVFFSLGKTPDRKTSKYWKDGIYPWVSISDMVDQGIVIATKDKITETALVDKFNCRLVPKGTLLMSFKLTIGKMSILGVDAQHNEAIISIVPVSDIDDIQKTYLFNTLPLFTSFAETTDAIKGATLNSGKLAKMLVALPPLAEQKRIIERLNELTPLISDYGKLEIEEGTIIEQLPILLRKSILQYAIQGKLVPQDPLDEPASVLLERIRSEREKANGGKKSKAKTESYIFKNSDDNSYYPFDIPESWEWVQLSEICEINPAVNDTQDDYDAAFISMKLIDDGFNNHFQYEIKKWDDVKSGYTHFQNRDVAFAKITPCFENRKSVIMENLPNGIGAGTTELHILRAYPGIAPEYLLWFVKTPYFIDYGKEHFTGTAGQQRFGTKALANMYIPIPPTNEQKRIVEKIQAMIPIIPNSLIMRK